MESLIKRLLDKKNINEEQLSVIKGLQKSTGRFFSDLITELGFLSEGELKAVLSEFLMIPAFDPQDERISLEVTKFMPCDFVKKYNIFPVCIQDGCFFLAMANPLDLATRDIVRNVVNMPVKPLVSTKTELNCLIEKHYSKDESDIDSIIREMNTQTNDKTLIENKTTSEQEGQIINIAIDKENESQVVKLVNVILGEAVRMRATDVHIDPQERFVDIRFRIDGTLKSILKVPKELRASLAARIKIVTCLNIAETRASQDGRASIFVTGKKIDIRIATIPTFYGEKISMRLLDKSEAKIELSKIGLIEQEINIIIDAVCQPQGIILTTGPTGSGKTSTLYAALNFLRTHTNKHIVTIEDPIEYLMEGLNQIQVNPLKNITFSTGLRSILRQDPNVILVGEIRDRETADIAFRASLTGHLVLSTLHTNSAAATLTRLFDIGLEPYLIGSTLSLIIAQRLIKMICPDCIAEHKPERHIIDKFKTYIDQFHIKTFNMGKGCKECNHTGYLGRTAIFEILRVNNKIKELIARRAPEDVIYRVAKNNGLRSLAEAGIEKVALKLTALEEIFDVVETSGGIGKTESTEIPELSNSIVKLVFGDDKIKDIYGK